MREGVLWVPTSLWSLPFFRSASDRRVQNAGLVRPLQIRRRRCRCRRGRRFHDGGRIGPPEARERTRRGRSSAAIDVESAVKVRKPACPLSCRDGGGGARRGARSSSGTEHVKKAKIVVTKQDVTDALMMVLPRRIHHSESDACFKRQGVPQTDGRARRCAEPRARDRREMNCGDLWRTSALRRWCEQLTRRWPRGALVCVRCRTYGGGELGGDGGTVAYSAGMAAEGMKLSCRLRRPSGRAVHGKAAFLVAIYARMRR